MDLLLRIFDFLLSSEEPSPKEERPSTPLRMEGSAALEMRKELEDLKRMLELNEWSRMNELERGIHAVKYPKKDSVQKGLSVEEGEILKVPQDDGMVQMGVPVEMAGADVAQVDIPAKTL